MLRSKGSSGEGRGALVLTWLPLAQNIFCIPLCCFVLISVQIHKYWPTCHLLNRGEGGDLGKLLMECLAPHAQWFGSEVERDIITVISRWRTSLRFINIPFTPKLFPYQKSALQLVQCMHEMTRLIKMDGWLMDGAHRSRQKSSTVPPTYMGYFPSLGESNYVHWLK